METGKEIEGDVSVETSFTKDDEVDEKKKLQREEEEQYQSKSNKQLKIYERLL